MIEGSVGQIAICPKSKSLAPVAKRRSLLPVEPNFSSYPKTRYYGSKRKQLSWLFPKLKLLEGETVLDAFGGTGTVSLLFSQLGKSVTYNDVFRFHQISAQALLGDIGNLSLHSKRISNFLSAVKPQTGHIAKTFDGLYFSRDENRWLDGAMAEVCQKRTKEEKAILLYCLFQACLCKRPFNLFHRANLYLRHSTQPVSFGNRVTWDKSFGDHMQSAYRELIRGRELLRKPINVLPPGSAQSVNRDFDIVYLDPPYFNSHRSTESYSQRYHFLEGLARYKEWPSLIDHSTALRNLYESAVPHEWRSKAAFEGELFSVIKHFSRSTVVLSYVANAYPNEDRIANYFKSLFSSTTIFTQDYHRTLSKRERTELLFIGVP